MWCPAYWGTPYRCVVRVAVDVPLHDVHSDGLVLTAHVVEDVYDVQFFQEGKVVLRLGDGGHVLLEEHEVCFLVPYRLGYPRFVVKGGCVGPHCSV